MITNNKLRIVIFEDKKILTFHTTISTKQRVGFI